MFYKSKVMDVIRDYCIMIDGKDISHKKSCEFFDRLFSRLKEMNYKVTISKSNVSTVYYRESLDFLNNFIINCDNIAIKILLCILIDLDVNIDSLNLLNSDLNLGEQYKEIVDKITEKPLIMDEQKSIPKETVDAYFQQYQKNMRKDIINFYFGDVITFNGNNNTSLKNIGDNNDIQIGSSKIMQCKNVLNELLNKIEELENVDKQMVADLRLVEQSIKDNNTEEEIDGFAALITKHRTKINAVCGLVGFGANFTTLLSFLGM